MLIKLKEQKQQRPLGGGDVLLPVPLNSSKAQSKPEEAEKPAKVDSTNLLVTRF
jgi:hypothetical protein